VTTFPAPVDVLVISGPVGVGKSTTAYEVSNQLQAAGIGHALLDSDELDRLFPMPAYQVELSEQNLRAVWSSFAERGTTRLVLVGVFIDVEAELDWLRRSIPGARWIVVLLLASEETLGERLSRREIGSGLQYHIGRSRMQAARFGWARSLMGSTPSRPTGGPSSMSPTSCSGSSAGSEHEVAG
jgi:hypothetical protein